VHRYPRCGWLIPATVALYLALPLTGFAQESNCAGPADQQDQEQDQEQDQPGQPENQQQDQSQQPGRQACPTPLSRSLGAIEAYVSAPARWDLKDWAYFGGTVAAVGVASHFDSTVRSDLVGHAPVSPGAGATDTLQDALPAGGLFLATWAYAKLIDDEDGIHESHAMLEAAVLSGATAEALGYIAGRERPDQSLDPGRWRAGGSSFPSFHTAAAFAIGTVLAESGNSRYRWVRRVLGYGVAGFTAYERLAHNDHWLSDTVAGAALGAASARFAMNREHDAGQQGEFAFSPIYRGVMLTYTLKLH
jgi:PAP2 superfamily